MLLNSLPLKENIVDLIFCLRGTRIMLDRDLARFYQVKPIRLREQVKRNTNRFPNDFMFQLTDIEIDTMVSQNAIPSKQVLGGSLSLIQLTTVIIKIYLNYLNNIFNKSHD